MAHDKLFINDVGHVFTVDVQNNITGVNTATLEILKEDGTIENWITSVTNAGSGILTYVTTIGDINQVGIYEAQAFVWSSSLSNFHGDVFNFEVFSRWTP